MNVRLATSRVTVIASLALVTGCGSNGADVADALCHADFAA
jgi:hypothetical protein